MTNRRKFGDKWEEEAHIYLRENSYVILEKNFQRRIGEVDVIALAPSYSNNIHQDLCFIEIRTRSENALANFGPPEMSLTPGKARKMRQVALLYLQLNPAYQNHIIRFDFLGGVVESGTDQKKTSVRWQLSRAIF